MVKQMRLQMRWEIEKIISVDDGSSNEVQFIGEKKTASI